MSASASTSCPTFGNALRAPNALRLQWFTAPPAATPKTVVATGVFDLLHVGHLRFLHAARAAGQMLLVGVEDDARTRARKGGGRPLVPVGERCELLASLRPVDGVFVISGPADLAPAVAYRDLLAQLAPARLAFTAGDPVAAGRRAVAAAIGADVVEIPHVAGRSTTAMLASVSLTRLL